VPPGAVLVLESLRALPEVPPLSDQLLQRPWQLVEIFLDHAERLQPADRLYLITEFLANYFDRVAMEVVESWLLMLDLRIVADDAMAKLYAQIRTGQRMQPFSRWAQNIVEQVCERGRFEAEFSSVQEVEGASPEESHRAKVTLILNRLDMPWRRVAWLSWVEQRNLTEVVEHTGLPLEQVEHMLDQINQQAIEEYLGEVREQHPDEPGSDAFWDAMGEPPEKEGDDG